MARLPADAPKSQAEHEALLQFLYMAPVGLVQTALDGAIRLMNPLSLNLLLPLQGDVKLTNLFTAIETVAPELRGMVEQFVGTRGMVVQGFRFRVSAGIRDEPDPRILEISIMKVDSDRLMAVLSDATLTVKREEQIKQGSAWFSGMLSGPERHAVLRLDADGMIVAGTEALQALTGHSEAAVHGRHYSMFFERIPLAAHRYIDYLHEAGESGWSLQESWCVRQDGTAFWSCTMLAAVASAPKEQAAIAGAHAGAYLLIIRDIHHRRDASASMMQPNTQDFLTGLLNRRTFIEMAELEIRRVLRSPRPLSLLLLDADLFKNINDSLGHPAGDVVLRRLSDVVAQTVRGTDVTGRIGGEEFAVLLPCTETEQAVDLAERIRRNVEVLEIDIDGHAVRVTISIGVAALTPGMTGLPALMKRADRALYDAKQNGRNCVMIAGA